MALVRSNETAAFTASAASRYEQATGNHPAVYVCTAADGVSLAPFAEA